MVIINDRGELEGIEGTVSELVENSAVLYATVLRHVREDHERSTGMQVLTEVLTEAWIRTVMDLLESEDMKVSVIAACKRVGETGVIEDFRYKANIGEGVVS